MNRPDRFSFRDGALQQRGVNVFVMERSRIHNLRSAVFASLRVYETLAFRFAECLRDDGAGIAACRIRQAFFEHHGWDRLAMRRSNRNHG